MADGLPVSDGAPAVQPTPMVPSQAPAPKETPAKTVALLALQAFNEELQNIGGIPKSEMALWQSHAEKGASQIEEEHLEKISTYLPQAHAQGKKDPFIFFEEIKEQHRANFFTPSGEVISDILRIVKGDLNKLSLHLKQTFEEVKNTITSLDLHEAPLSFENLQILLKNCPNLRSINLDGCGLDEKSLLLLLSRPELSFSIKGYQRISDHAQQHLEALLQYKQQVSDYAFCEASRMRFSVVDELLEFKGLFLPEVECIKEFDTKLKKKTDEILSRIMADATQSVPTVAGLLGLIQKQETQALLLRELGSFFWTQSFSLVYDLQKERLKIICLNNGCPQARVDRLETIVTHLYQKKLEDVLEKAKTVHGEPSILLQQEAEKIKHQNKALVSFFAAL
ncbi:MAG TPA: hypothetical protein VN457_01195, partial [Chlamydiales bacterium]|nr:hypothetical protein [Chlamydiales bacterium]